MRKNNISKSRCIAIICTIMAVIGAVILFTDSAERGEALPTTIMFAIVALICWCISFSAPKTKEEVHERKRAKIERKEYAERMKAYAGVYLSEEQIQLLEKRIRISVPMSCR